MSEAMAPELVHVLSAAGERKAGHVVVLDVRGKSSVADFYVIMSGRSNRQVSALAEHIGGRLRDLGLKPLGMEGMAEGQWVLMDYVNVVVHIFYDPVRGFYDLEGLWADAPRLDPESVLAGK